MTTMPPAVWNAYFGAHVHGKWQACGSSLQKRQWIPLLTDKEENAAHSELGQVLGEGSEELEYGDRPRANSVATVTATVFNPLTEPSKSKLRLGSLSPTTAPGLEPSRCSTKF